jgi:hypothetical protein
MEQDACRAILQGIVGNSVLAIADSAALAQRTD